MQFLRNVADAYCPWFAINLCARFHTQRCVFMFSSPPCSIPLLAPWLLSSMATGSKFGIGSGTSERWLCHVTPCVAVIRPLLCETFGNPVSFCWGSGSRWAFPNLKVSNVLILSPSFLFVCPRSLSCTQPCLVLIHAILWWKHDSAFSCEGPLSWVLCVMSEPVP